MGVEVIDNYLPWEIFDELRSMICWNDGFPWSIVKQINDDRLENDLCNWYGIHMFYENDNPTTPFYNQLLRPLLIRKMIEDGRLKSLLRAKANFYSYTQDIVNHQSHFDYSFSHKASVYSLNTCNGHTRIGDEIVESVENRIVFFDGSLTHNSTSTSDNKGRFNINLNFF
jgi:hypothetical protein